MAQHSMHTDIPAIRIGEPGDRWRCSLCDGYVRGNAPRCKHCHALFGAPEPRRADADTLWPSFNQAKPPVRSASYFLQVVLSWCVVGYLIYLCWTVGIAIRGYAGIAIGPLLFVTILTPLLCLWIYTHHSLPKPTVRAYVHDLVFVWMMLSVTIALPGITMLSLDHAIFNWWRLPLGLTIAASLAVFGLFQLPLWTWLVRGQLSERWRMRLASTDSKSFLHIWIEVMCFGVLPYTLYMWALNYLAEPYSFVVRFGWLAWLLILIQERLRTWIRARIMQWWQRIGTSRANS